MNFFPEAPRGAVPLSTLPRMTEEEMFG
jgi:hypothetical protein